MTDVQLQATVERIHEAAEHGRVKGGPPLEDFLRDYYRHVPEVDLLERTPDDLLSIALTHRDLAAQRPVGRANLTCFNPTLDSDGWTSSHTIIQVVTDDMPFLVDSVSARLGALGRPIHRLIHPQIHVRRSATGDLEEAVSTAAAEAAAKAEIVGVGKAGKTGKAAATRAAGAEGAGAGTAEVATGGAVRPFGDLRESWIHLEIDRESDERECAEIAESLRRVLSDVREAVEDWGKMRASARLAASELRAAPPIGLDPDEISSAADFLEWMADGQFTFLGARDYDLTKEGAGAVVVPVAGSGLGLLRNDPPMNRVRPILTGKALETAQQRQVLFVTKANSRATVHRSVFMDYVGVRRFDANGLVIGEHRFLGLFTASAYAESVSRIPYLKDKVDHIMRLSGFDPDSHSGKDLLGILEDYPRDELLQASIEDLLDVGTQIMHLPERRGTRIFLRPDDFGRFVSCLVFIPRDRYNTSVRVKMQSILAEAYGGTVDYTTRVSESALARLHFVVRLPAGQRIPPLDESALESKIADATRTWDEDFLEAAQREYGEEESARLAAAYGLAFSTSYKEDFEVKQGVADLRHLEELTQEDSTRLVLYKPRWSPDTVRRFKLFRRSPLSLTQVLPLFTHMGVEVVDERPYEVARHDGVRLYVYDFGLQVRDVTLWGSMTHARLRELFEAAVGAVWSGEAESDGFNSLVLRAQLTWRQVVIVRMVAKYLRQTGSAFSQSYLEDALLHNWQIAAKLVALFEARFDPDRDSASRAKAEEVLTAQILESLDAVTSLDEDRIVRAFLGVIKASLRTNYYQRTAEGAAKTYVSLKLDPQQVPDLPAPRPAFEIWVYSPRVEGVHLRFGPVARGGLRWSDRREDFRTEVLGLVKAQMVKNAVIVPTGSKGGFFAKQLPDPALDRGAWVAEGIEAYKIFIRSLLDLTDNRVDANVVPPERVVRHDGDDSYLVVAADKGTATFSDIANGVSQDFGFWLDDAFASGGSSGYDHKAMGITARGAWESVKRHFRELGHDTQSEDFTVVGVGDMSGDVFGNGMLLSEHIRLVAAFDHRHIFLDPTPDAASSYAERARLFALPSSSWADYDAALLSEGGGIFPRSAKSIPVTDPMATALNLPTGTRAMTPTELIHALLLAPVDLLWNGGIGTYVKASTESHADVGDRANDAIRVDGRQLRVKVVGEGGNLGLSQRGRIEAALAGRRVNTDAIDNSAGVDTSDHEVNIKILLSQAVREGDLTQKQRNTLLASMTKEVGAAVLRDNYEQNVLLGNARAQDVAMLAVHQRLIHELEERGSLDRALEFLPNDNVLAERLEAGVGLTSPEIAVLVAYSKLGLKEDLLSSGLPDDPWFVTTLSSYFPTALRERFATELAQHPLRREIITTAVANSMVNWGGMTFAFRATEETGATPEQVARAFVIAREVFDLGSYVAELEALDNVVTTQVQTRLYLEVRRLLDRVVRWFLSSRPTALDVAAEVKRYGPTIKTWGDQVPGLLVGVEGERYAAQVAGAVADGVPPQVAARGCALLDTFSLLDIVDVCGPTEADPEDVLKLYFVVSERLRVDSLLQKITALPRDNRWDSLARGALRDDLYGVLVEITRGVLESTPQGAGSPPEERFATWSEVHRGSLERTERSLAAIERLDRPTIAALSVALRTLRSLVRSGSAPSA